LAGEDAKNFIDIEVQKNRRRESTTHTNNNINVMSEGGLFPWKVQKIVTPKHGRISSYASLSRPLPDPPRDMTWVQDVTSREWRLVPLVVHPTVAIAIARRDTTMADDDDDGMSNGDNSSGAVTNDGSGTSFIAASVVPIVDARVDYDDRCAASSGSRYHEVQPTDTFQGICLMYKVTPTELRRANGMMGGCDLRLAPKSLVVPWNDDTAGHKKSTEDTRDEERYKTTEGKIAIIKCKACRITGDRLAHSEALAYLEMAEGDVDGAIRNACEDYRWSREQGER
jgi:hypothetical protein